MSSSVVTTDARFSCNICLEAVNEEPVVTACGHLYCWPCLYEWLQPGLTLAEREALEFHGHDSSSSTAHRSSGILFAATNNNNSSTTVDASRRVCPTCKAACSLQRVVPIYVRTNNVTDTTTAPGAESDAINEPDTTTGLRIRRSNTPRRPVAGRDETPHLLQQAMVPANHHASPSLSHGVFPIPTPIRDGEYLSRILLLLGSFVVLCLLLFP